MGLRRSDRTRSRTSGVSARQIASLTRKAEKVTRDHGYCAEQHHRGVRSPNDPRARQPEEARQTKVGNHDHHAEKQRQGVEIDGLVGVVERERAAGDHQGGTHQGDTGAIERQAGNTTDREGYIA